MQPEQLISVLRCMKPKQTDDKLRRIEKLVKLLDEQFRLPGTNFHFGVDPILNLIPVAGDVSGFLISGALLLTMARHGVSRKVVILMALNVFLDFVIGGIPIIGQIFDFFFKANKRNLSLLRKHYIEGKYSGSGKDVLIILGLILIIFFILSIYLLVKLFQWFFGLF